MKTTILTIVMALIGMTAYAQKFTYFNEAESTNGVTVISPKGQTSLFYGGGEYDFEIKNMPGLWRKLSGYS